MPQIGPLEIAVVLLIALLVFGPNRLPEMAKQVGGVLRELRRVQQNLRDEIHHVINDESDAAAPPPSLPPKDPEAGSDAAESGTSESSTAESGAAEPGTSESGAPESGAPESD